MPYTSHGHPYGTVSPDDPRPTLVAKCGGPPMCPVCRIEAEPAPPAEPEPATDTQAERMADAYDLGIKAEALRDFADQLDADLPPARPLPPHVIATLARERAEDLDAEAEELATAAEPAPPADALAMPTGVHYTTWLDQITPTLVALGWTPPPGPADSPDERRDRIAAAIRQAAERCECDGSCVCGLGIDCYLGSRADVVVVGKPSVIAAAVLSAGSVPAPAPPAELTEAQYVTVRRDDLDAVLTHIKYCAENDGDVPYGEVLSRLWAALAPGEPTTEARCPSCDHLTEGHTAAGCWYAIDDHSPSVDGICPCTRVHKPAATPEQDGGQAEGGQ